MILLVGAEKGGVGKSTIACNLAVHLAGEAVDVVILDTDTQATCAHFAERRNELGHRPEILCLQRTGDVGAALRDLARRYRVVVVDAGGRDSRELRSAIAVADLLLTPIRASQADLETLPTMNTLVNLAKPFNPSLQAFAVLSMAPSNPAIREVEEARELLADFDQLTLAKTVIRDRKVYRDALLGGRGVVEMGNGTARAEIQLLAQEFFEMEAASVNELLN